MKGLKESKIEVGYTVKRIVYSQEPLIGTSWLVHFKLGPLGRGVIPDGPNFPTIPFFLLF